MSFHRIPLPLISSHLIASYSMMSPHVTVSSHVTLPLHAIKSSRVVDFYTTIACFMRGILRFLFGGKHRCTFFFAQMIIYINIDILKKY